MSKYLLDTNVFLQAKDREYALDLCPGFWAWLDRMNQDGRAYTIEACADEFLPAGDEVAIWAKTRGARLILPHASDGPMLAALPKVSSWATSKHYPPAAISRFFGCADFFLVAYALANGFTVVTNEANQPLSHTVKIPTACDALGVPCLTTFKLLRAEKVTFCLATS